MLFILPFILITLHGLIHLLGFAKYWHRADIPQLSGRTLIDIPEKYFRLYGYFWLLAAQWLLFVSLGYMFHQEWWPPMAGIGVLISQTLVFVAWPDAKFGTVANVLILLVALTAGAEFRFDRAVREDSAAVLLGAKQPSTEVISAGSIASLPAPVRRWLTVAGVVGTTPVRAVRLTQRGKMRPQPEGEWIDATASQVFSVEPPAFVWSTSMDMMPLVTVLGADRYTAGHGRMHITAYGLVTITEAEGEQMDQGTALRYLAEICWFPTAAVSSHISWKPVDSTTAQATLSYGGLSVSGLFTFGETGDVVGFEAERYMDREGGATLERWVITMEEHQTLSTYRIPVRSNVTWRLKEGDRTWFTVEIASIEYR